MKDWRTFWWSQESMAICRVWNNAIEVNTSSLEKTAEYRCSSAFFFNLNVGSVVPAYYLQSDVEGLKKLVHDSSSVGWAH